jgi:hypothetical protein
MSNNPFNDELTLAKQAEELGEKALAQGLIPSFVVRHYPDSWQFFVPNETEAEPMTPEEAYLAFKKLLG